MTKRISTTVPDGLHAYLVEFARANDLTMPDLVATMLYEYIIAREKLRRLSKELSEELLDSSVSGTPH